MDSNAAISLAENPTYSRRTRHIEIKHHFIRDMIIAKDVEVQKIKGTENPADMLAKPISSTLLMKFRIRIGLKY